MAAGRKKSLALDANLLIDLAEGQDFAHEFREEFQKRGYTFSVPPTAAAELELLAASGKIPQSSFANSALEQLNAWACHPFAFQGLDHGSFQDSSEQIACRRDCQFLRHASPTSQAV